MIKHNINIINLAIISAAIILSTYLNWNIYGVLTFALVIYLIIFEPSLITPIVLSICSLSIAIVLQIAARSADSLPFINISLILFGFYVLNLLWQKYASKDK